MLDDGHLRRVGASRPRRVDVRILAATNADVKGAVERGTLRADLYYRLNVVRIEVTPLRERREDIPALAEHLLRRLTGGRGATLAPGEAEKLMVYAWPGNARELRNVLERALVLQSSGPLRPSDLLRMNRASAPARSEPESDRTPLPARSAPGSIVSLAEVERRHLLAILERSPVDVLVTDLRMPEADGLELVAWVAGRRVPIQIIVLTAHASEKTRKALDELGALVCLDKPIELSALHDAVDRMLHLPRAHLGGVTLPGFVQLLEAEKRTCALRVKSMEGAGTLVFDRGVIVDAWSRELEGDEAAMAILALRECMLDVVGSMPTQARRVTHPLSFLLLESARRLDEAESEGKGHWEVLRVAAETAESGSETALDPWSELNAKEEDKEKVMANIQQSMRAAMEIEGAVGAALVDYQSGMTLGHAGGGAALDLDHGRAAHLHRASLSCPRPDVKVDVAAWLTVAWRPVRRSPHRA